MNTKNNLGNIPKNYLMCTHASCTKCNSCLRYLAYESLSDLDVILKIINPKNLSLLTNDCPYFRPLEKICYAKGFIGILDSLPNKVWKSVSHKLQTIYNERDYYRLRKGEKLLTPTEQENIISLVRQHGITDIPDFDAYVYDYEW